jgi:hypothetical protein
VAAKPRQVQRQEHSLRAFVRERGGDAADLLGLEDAPPDRLRPRPLHPGRRIRLDQLLGDGTAENVVEQVDLGDDASRGSFAERVLALHACAESPHLTPATRLSTERRGLR